MPNSDESNSSIPYFPNLWRPTLDSWNIYPGSLSHPGQDRTIDFFSNGQLTVRVTTYGQQLGLGFENQPDGTKFFTFRSTVDIDVLIKYLSACDKVQILVEDVTKLTDDIKWTFIKNP